MPFLLYILGGLLAVVAVWFAVEFNALVKARNRVDEAWSGVDVQLKRRADLVPNLVSAVAGYAEHERTTLEHVTEARSDTQAAGNVVSRAQAESGLSSALVALGAVAEQYPQLMATDNFKQLQLQLEKTETEIAAARQIYNANVRFLNDRIQMFPSSLVARIASFEPRDFFELALPAEAGLPKASFA